MTAEQRREWVFKLGGIVFLVGLGLVSIPLALCVGGMGLMLLIAGAGLVAKREAEAKNTKAGDDG